MTEATFDPDGLYERDVVAWAEEQAAALRRRESGHNLLDYDNLAEEIDDVGRSVTHACESFIDLAVEHLLKLEYVDQPENVRGWRVSVQKGRRGLAKQITPTLRGRLPAYVPEAVAAKVDDLVLGGVIADDGVAEERLARPYSWEELTDVDWWPRPAYASREAA